MTREQQRDREKSEAEKAMAIHGHPWPSIAYGPSQNCCHSQATWSPYVAHVDEWLEDAAEPDDETDSWVARTADFCQPWSLFQKKTGSLSGKDHNGSWKKK